ncbi:MAG: Tetratricopeptide repeat protein [Chlorobi bacterium OLB7]|nr:MAG: Tetratricopeptide repeat protein [Chlorobi bacterium OLB7]
MKKVFPELHSICRQRGITLSEIDLRWGLTEEESLYGNVVRRCLEEVDRCRPWFICITGDRYGYTPTIAEIHKDPELLRRFPWVEEAAIEGMSIMEMEVRYGAIGTGKADGEMANPRARFYFRDAAQGAPLSLKHPNEAAKLDALKQDVFRCGATIRQFRDAATLGKMVHDDLVALIEESFPALSHASNPLQQERRRHEAFALSRRQAYIPPRPKALAHLSRVAEQARSNAASPGNAAAASNGMVVLAPSGSGKSALIAYWANHYRRRYPGAFVVEHYVGIGSEQGEHTEILHHLSMELRERGFINAPLPANQNELHDLLPHWFAAVHGQPLILLIDGLNQLGEHGRNLAWLPGHLPPNVAVVATTTDPQAAQVLADRGWEMIEIEPLRPEERQAVIVRFLGESYKALNARQLQRIGEAPHCSHPLFLRTFLEELRVFGHHELLDQQIDWYLSATDTHQLFQRMLQRMEGDFGEGLVRRVMTLLWGARRGLRESELAAITRSPRLQISSLVASLDYHLVTRDGLLTFFHDYLRIAVEQRYLSTPAKQRAIHARIAKFFGTHATSHRRIEEEPYQWWKANDPERLHALLADPDIFHALWEGERLGLIGYWRFLEGTFNPAETYRAAAVTLRQSQPDREVGFLRQLAAFLLTIGKPEDAEAAARESVRLAREQGHPQLHEALIELGEVLRQHNQFSEAEQIAREGLQHPDRLANPLYGIDLLSTILLDSGAFDEAERVIRSALENTGTLSSKQNIDLYGNLGLLFHYRGRLREAETIQRKVMEMRKRSMAENTPELADTHHNLGRVLFDLGRLEESVAQFQHAADIWLKVFGPDHPLLLLAHNGLADVMLRQGNYQQAMEAYHAVLAARQRLFGMRHLHTVQSGLSMALVLRHMNQHDEAEKLYRQLLAVLREIVHPHHHFTIGCMNNLASVLLAQKAYAEAIELLDEVLNARIATQGEHHGDVVATMLLIGDARLQQGEAEEARTITEQAVHLSQQVLGAQHQRTAMALRCLGVIMGTLGDVAAAERYLRQALQIYETTLGTDHPQTKAADQLLQEVIAQRLPTEP